MYHQLKQVATLFCLCFLLSILMPISIVAQDNSNWKLKHIGTEDGLSNRFVNYVTQDNRGYTWISTNFGLNRYDGHRIDVLTRESHQLWSNTVFELLPDSKNHIWVVHRETSLSSITNIDVLDPVSFKIQSLQDYLVDTLPFKFEDIYRVESGPSGTILFLTKQSNIYKVEENRIKLLLPII